METRDSAAFKDYRFADIPEEDLMRITQLEKEISNLTNENIVLIAYQNSKADSF